jgi:hypothetical protein
MADITNIKLENHARVIFTLGGFFIYPVKQRLCCSRLWRGLTGVYFKNFTNF